MEIEDTVVLRFAPDDYIEENVTSFSTGDFFDDNHFPSFLGLESETSLRTADKAEDWCLLIEEKGKLYQDLDTNEED
jgi:hypothetical protein